MLADAIVVVVMLCLSVALYMVWSGQSASDLLFKAGLSSQPGARVRVRDQDAPGKWE